MSTCRLPLSDTRECARPVARPRSRTLAPLATLAVLAALTLAWPAAANACTLRQLLDLPLERLLRVGIKAGPVAGAPRTP